MYDCLKNQMNWKHALSFAHFHLEIPQLLENSQLTLMDEMERLMCNFHYLGYYCSPNLSIHQNSRQEPTWNILVTKNLNIEKSSVIFAMIFKKT